MARADAIRKLITICERRLQVLEEQRARYGFDAPPHIILEIEDIKKTIDELNKKLAGLGESEISTLPLTFAIQDIQKRIDQIEKELTVLGRGAISTSSPVQSEFYSLSPERPGTLIAAGAALPELDLRPGLDIDLNESEDALIKRLFSNCRTVVIEHEFGDGYSGCRVFLVSSWSDHQHAPLVVKIGPIDLIQDERRRHQTYVADTLPLLAADIRHFIEHDQLGAIGYTYLGGAILGDSTCSLGDYYRRHPASKILKVLKILLVDALGARWYMQRRTVPRPLYFEECYGPHFPVELTLTLDEINRSELPPDSAYHHFKATTQHSKYQAIEIGMAVQLDGFIVRRHRDQRIDISHPRGLPRLRVNIGPKAGELPALELGAPVWLRGTVTSRRSEDLSMIVKAIFADIPDAAIDPSALEINVAGAAYTNPLAVYQTHLNQRLPQNLAPIHGDLHLSNVFVDRFGKPWVIDPGRVAEGHVLFDFIELETHLRHVILGDMDFTLADLGDFEDRLIDHTTAAKSSLPPAHPELAKAFKVILGIRKFAARYRAPEYQATGRSFAQEYFPALFLYTLATLKHYQDNGARSARHAFLTAALLATFLEHQPNQPTDPFIGPTMPESVPKHRVRDMAGAARKASTQPPAEQQEFVAEPQRAAESDLPIDLTVTDPVLEYQAYYLAKVAGDTEPQEVARQQVFVAELQRLADRLRAWLKVPPMAIVWEQEAPTPPSMMIRRYYSGQWQNADDTLHVWLVAYQMHDTYLVRCAVEQPGQGYPPNAFDDLRVQLPWQPDTDLPEWLGQHQLYYTSRFSGSVVELTRIVFHDPLLWHVALSCGELYCLPKLETPYLLVGATPQQEDVADRFFDSLAPQLGWYIHKIVRQKKQYDIYLVPTINAMEQLASTYLAEARMLSRRIRQAEKNTDTLIALHEQVQALVGLAVGYQAFLTTVEHILHAIDINIDNYRRVTELDELLVEPMRNEIFIKQRRRLELVSEQIKADIKRWQITLDSAEKSLMLLRA